MNAYLEINQYHVFVGLDWSDDKHDIYLQDLATKNENSPLSSAGLKILAHGLKILKNDLVVLSLLLLN